MTFEDLNDTLSVTVSFDERFENDKDGTLLAAESLIETIPDEFDPLIRQRMARIIVAGAKSELTRAACDHASVDPGTAADIDRERRHTSDSTP